MCKILFVPRTYIIWAKEALEVFVFQLTGDRGIIIEFAQHQKLLNVSYSMSFWRRYVVKCHYILTNQQIENALSWLFWLLINLYMLQIRHICHYVKQQHLLQYCRLVKLFDSFRRYPGEGSFLTIPINIWSISGSPIPLPDKTMKIILYLNWTFL